MASIDCEELLVPPLADGEVPPAALLPVEGCEDELVPLLADVLPLVDGDVLLLVDGAVPPAAPLLVEGCEVEPDALPEPEDWLVCAPCVIVEDGLVVVAFWLAEAEPVETP